MSSTPLSQSPALRVVANVFGTIFVGFGVNAILRPENALSFFEFRMPTSTGEKKLVENLMFVYGVRDIFMGLAIYSAAFFGNCKALGWIVIAGSAVALADGYVCWTEGKGEWGHWSYAPVLTVVGALLLGSLDRA